MSRLHFLHGAVTGIAAVWTPTAVLCISGVDASSAISHGGVIGRAIGLGFVMALILTARRRG